MSLPPLTADTASQFKTQTRPLNLRPSAPTSDNNIKRAALSSADMLRMQTFKLKGGTWSTMSQEQKNETTQADLKAGEEADSPLGIAKETAKGTISTLAGGIGKFIRSAVATVADPVTNLIQGKKGLDIFQPNNAAYQGDTYQSDMQKTSGQVFDDSMAGKPDSNSQLEMKAAGATGDVVSGAADTLGGAEAAIGITKLAAPISDYLSKKAMSSSEQAAFKEAVDVVTPKMTAKETQEALASGRGKGGGLFSKTKITPDKRLLEVADATKGIVKKGATGAENINSVRTALGNEAESLKTQIQSVDHPVPIRELSSRLNSAEVPLTVKSDATLSRQLKLVKDAAVKIASGGKGNVSGLLDARKGFDALIDKEFPTLYDRENAPMRNAVTSIRNAMNDFIQEQLPDNVAFKSSLKKQSLFYDAIDNIAGKSVDETRTTGLQRIGSAVKKHPVGAIVTGAATGEGIRKLTTGNF